MIHCVYQQDTSTNIHTGGGYACFIHYNKRFAFLFLSLKESGCSWRKLKHISSNNSASTIQPKKKKQHKRKSLSKQAKNPQRYKKHHFITHPRKVQVRKAAKTTKTGVIFFTNLLLDIRSFHIVLRLTLLKLTGQQHKLQLDGLD